MYFSFFLLVQEMGRKRFRWNYHTSSGILKENAWVVCGVEDLFKESITLLQILSLFKLKYVIPFLAENWRPKMNPSSLIEHILSIWSAFLFLLSPVMSVDDQYSWYDLEPMYLSCIINLLIYLSWEKWGKIQEHLEEGTECGLLNWTQGETLTFQKPKREKKVPSQKAVSNKQELLKKLFFSGM